MERESPQDLISLASQKGLLDEAAARERLQGKPATAETLVESGILTREQLDELQAQTTVRDRFPSDDTRKFVLPPDVAEAARDERNRFGSYIRIRELGEGAFGTVYLAWDTKLRRRVALKILKGHESDMIARFKREARTAAALSHPNIATVFEVGAVGNDNFIALQFIQGQTLARLRLSPQEAVEAMQAAAEAVDFANRQHVIHRDLKPQNVMKSDDGRVTVLDFGLARLTDPGSSMTLSGTVIGTPAYMSPEMARGESADARSDVYGLGATLYDLVTGKRPFVGGTPLEIMRQVVDRDPIRPRRRNPDLDRDVETIVLKAMEKDPERRYQSAGEMAEDLARCHAGDAILARPASWAYRIQKNVRKNRRLYGVGTAGFALALAILVPMWRTAERAKDIEEAKTNARRQLDAIRHRVERATLALYRKGESLARLEGERAFALVEIDRIERGYPPIPEVPTLRGDVLSLDPLVLQDQARFHTAMAAYDRALQTDSEYAPANLGRGLLGLRKYLYELAVAHGVFGVLREEMVKREPLRRQSIRDLEIAIAHHAGDERMMRLAEAGSALAAADLDLADRLATEALEVSPHEDFYFVRANVRLARYQYRKALDDIEAAITTRPNYPEAFLLQAVLAWLTQQYDITGRAIAEARRLAPDHPLGLSMQVLYDFIHHRTEGIPGILERLSRDRGLGPATAALAWVALGELDRALELSGRAIELNPDLDAAYGVRSVAHLVAGDEAAAKADLKYAVRRNPAGGHPYIIMALLEINRGKYAKAEEYCTRVIEATDENALAWLTRGVARVASGKLVKGGLDTAKALKLDPHLINIVAPPDRTEAEKLFVKSRTAHRSAIARGRQKNPIPQYERAISYLDEALKLNPKTALRARILRFRAAVRTSWGSYREGRKEDPTKLYGLAVGDLDVSTELVPSSAYALIDRGWLRVRWALYKLSQEQDVTEMARSAVQDLDAALAMTPESAGVLWRRGRAHVLLKDWAAADADFERAAALNPSTVPNFKRSWEYARNHLPEP